MPLFETFQCVFLPEKGRRETERMEWRGKKNDEGITSEK